jgi:hypothetical protein
MGTRSRSPADDPMTLGNMRANGVRSLEGVLLAVPPPCDLERRPVAGGDVKRARNAREVWLVTWLGSPYLGARGRALGVRE